MTGMGANPNVRSCAHLWVGVTWSGRNLPFRFGMPPPEMRTFSLPDCDPLARVGSCENVAR